MYSSVFIVALVHLFLFFAFIVTIHLTLYWDIKYEVERSDQRSEVKCSKLCFMATKHGQKNHWCEFKMMIMTFMEVKGQEVKCSKQ